MLLWIRMFQWMRLFNEFSHFIYLISKILSDIKIFNVMWFIVMAAFGNFFYSLNNNSKQDDENHYVGAYTCIKFIDALIEMYMFSIGETDIKSTRGAESEKGLSSFVAFILFVLSTFVLNIMFLNLIIAIISDTY